jgi:hypothetical protein
MEQKKGSSKLPIWSKIVFLPSKSELKTTTQFIQTSFLGLCMCTTVYHQNIIQYIITSVYSFMWTTYEWNPSKGILKMFIKLLDG